MSEAYDPLLGTVRQANQLANMLDRDQQGRIGRLPLAYDAEPPRRTAMQYTKVVCLAQPLYPGGHSKVLAQVMAYRPNSHVQDVVVSAILANSVAPQEIEVRAFRAGQLLSTGMIPLTCGPDEFHQRMQFPQHVRVTLGELVDQRLPDGRQALLRWRVEQPDDGDQVIILDTDAYDWETGASLFVERVNWVGTEEVIEVHDPIPRSNSTGTSLRRSFYEPEWDTDRWLLTSNSTNPPMEGDFIALKWTGMQWTITEWQYVLSDTLAVAQLGSGGQYELLVPASVGTDLLEDPPQHLPISVGLVWFNNQWNPVSSLPSSFLAWSSYYSQGWNYWGGRLDSDYFDSASSFLNRHSAIRGAICLAEWTGTAWVVTRAERRAAVIFSGELDQGGSTY